MRQMELKLVDFIKLGNYNIYIYKSQICDSQIKKEKNMKLNNSLKSLMALALVCGLTACQTPTESTGSSEPSTPVHEHSFAEAWSKDETHHWHEATCEHADAVEKEAHAWGEGEVTTQPTEEAKGEKTYTCVCGATKVEELDVLPHTHKFADEWSKDETHHWKDVTCGHEDAVQKVEHAWGEPNVVEGTASVVTTWTCTECQYEKTETETNLIVNYKYANGEKIKSEKIKVAPGETYSVESPAINFMAPDKAVVEGTMDADGEVVEVVYDYSNEPISNPVPGYRYDKFMVDETKGISFTMTTNGAYRDWEEMIAGDTFVVFNGCLRYRDSQYPQAFSGDWYDGGASEAALGRNYWDALLTRFDRNEIVVTWSINPDGSITAYKNGEKVLFFDANKEAEGFWNPNGIAKPKIYEFAQGIAAEIEEKGFRMGGYHNDGEGRHLSYHRNLTVGYAVNDAQAQEIAASYSKTTAVSMVDENGDAVRKTINFRDQANTEIKAPYVEGYQYLREEKAEGTAKFIYAPIGEEKVTDEIKAAGTNTVNTLGIPYEHRPLTQYWYVAGEGFTGDAVVTMNVTTKGGDWVDQSVLPVIFDTENKENCYIQRLDWFGTFHGTWNNGVHIDNPANGINALVRGNEWHNGGDWNTVAAPMIRAVLIDADINITFIKKGGSFTVNAVITANSGEYAGQSFNFNSCIINLPGSSFGFGVTGLNCTYTVNSVHY